MKPLLVLLVAVFAGLVAYVRRRSECRGGVITTGEAERHQGAALSAAACDAVMKAADQIAGQAAAMFSTLDQCSERFEACIRSAVADGFTPAPSGFSEEASGSTLTRQEPIYSRDNAGLNWSRC